jgi:hypothetical protein
MMEYGDVKEQKELWRERERERRRGLHAVVASNEIIV